MALPVCEACLPWRRRSIAGRAAALLTAALVVPAGACDTKLFTAEVSDPAVDETARVLLTGVRDTVADGATLLHLGVRLTGSPTTDRVVVLSTTAGLFLPSATPTTSVAFGAADTAAAVLRAPREPAVALIRAAVGRAVDLGQVRFRAALADTILVQPRDSFVVDGTAAGQLTLVASLRRTTGQVSPGIAVRFTDSLPGSRAGVFGTAAGVDTTGRTEVRYAPGPVDPAARGPRRLFACTDAARGGRVCGATTIYVR